MSKKILLTNGKITTKIWVLFIILFIYSSSSYAEFKQVHDLNKCSPPCWEVTGLIEKSDLDELSNFIQIMNKPAYTNPEIRLNSSGGDLAVAIKIGRQLRRFRSTIFTWHEGKCYSSCVFILAGGVDRFISNNIGIHRPYSTSTNNLNYKTIQSNQRKLKIVAKDYLEEMNVSPLLYDAMVRIPPEKIKILSKSELDFYGIVKTDPVEEEMWNSHYARKYGLSKTEYLHRKSQVNVSCSSEYNRGSRGLDNFKSFNKCNDRVLKFGK